MKRLVCEMCGDTDIVKQDGVYVCQSCGMKYSVEEAKKMMVEVEGTVEVQGTVTIQGPVEVSNVGQINNLLQLAKSSYDSKNYAQAENFCNQVIALDSSNFDAWKLKGEAINYQITGTNDRIAEVYNCIMTSYKVLPEDQKEEKRDEILASLRVCLEGEIDFALQLFEDNRPTNQMLDKVKKTFVRCASNVITSYKELGYGTAAAEEYKTKIKNYYIAKVNKVCDRSWENTVYYNYHRKGFNKEYHPTRDIMKQYLNEGQNLVALLEDAAGYFTDETPGPDKLENYRLRNYFARNLRNASSFKLMEHTTTNGYGAVISRYTQWEVDTTLTSEAIAAWNKIVDSTCKMADDTEIAMAKTDPATQERMIKDWIRKRDSIDTGLHFSGGWIFSTLLCAAAGIGFWYWGANEPYITGFCNVVAVIFFIGMVICAILTYAKAKGEQDDRFGEIARLDRKIAEARNAGKNEKNTISGTSGTPSIPQTAEEGKWVCQNCGTQNKNEYGQCKKCGKHRSK